jgi:preprotein translocase subunit SecB
MKIEVKANRSETEDMEFEVMLAVFAKETESKRKTYVV